MEKITCKKCKGECKPSTALENTWVSSDDFGGDAFQPGSTISKIGQPVIIDCYKCIECGHSFTLPIKTDLENRKLAMKWWNNYNLKIFQARFYFSKNWELLTGREIEIIYNKIHKI